MMRLFLVILLALVLAYVHAASEVRLCDNAFKDCRGERYGATAEATVVQESIETIDTLAAIEEPHEGEEEEVLASVEFAEGVDEETMSQGVEVLGMFSNIAKTISSVLRARCMTSCEWFGENEPFCTKCARPIIVYPKLTSVNKQCYSLPDDIKSGEITLNAVNDIKSKCIRLGECQCTGKRIENALAIRLLRRAVLATTKQFIEIVAKNVTSIIERTAKDPSCQEIAQKYAKEAIEKMTALENEEMAAIEKVADRIKNDKDYKEYLKEVHNRVQGKSFLFVNEVSQKVWASNCFAFQKFMNSLLKKQSVINFLSKAKSKISKLFRK